MEAQSAEGDAQSSTWPETVTSVQSTSVSTRSSVGLLPEPDDLIEDDGTPLLPISVTATATATATISPAAGRQGIGDGGGVCLGDSRFSDKVTGLKEGPGTSPSSHAEAAPAAWKQPKQIQAERTGAVNLLQANILKSQLPI